MPICFFRYQIPDHLNPPSQLEAPINLSLLDLPDRPAVKLAMIRSRVSLSHRFPHVRALEDKGSHFLWMT